MTKTIFTVWVGDGVVYEGTSHSQANHVNRYEKITGEFGEV